MGSAGYNKSKVTANGTSLRSTIPMNIADRMDIKKGTILKWGFAKDANGNFLVSLQKFGS